MAGDAADDGGGEAGGRTHSPLLAAERRPTSWGDVFDDLLDEVVEGGETVEASLDEFRIDVPLRYGEDAPRAEWGFDGTVRMHIEGTRAPLAGWLRWWRTRVEADEDATTDEGAPAGGSTD
jgi:hypothetical protein